MWSVVMYTAEVRKTFFRTEQRGEAEAYKAKMTRLVGANFTLDLVLDPIPVTPEQ